MGCEMLSSQHLDIIWAETLFTTIFVVRIALSAADHARQLFWCMLLADRIVKDHMHYTTLSIRLPGLKSDFATLKSSEGLAALLVPRAFTQRFWDEGLSLPVLTRGVSVVAGVSAQQACGVTLHAISQTAPDHLRRHASLAMPLAFFAMHQEKTEGLYVTLFLLCLILINRFAMHRIKSGSPIVVSKPILSFMYTANSVFLYQSPYLSYLCHIKPQSCLTRPQFTSNLCLFDQTLVLSYETPVLLIKPQPCWTKPQSFWSYPGLVI